MGAGNLRDVVLNGLYVTQMMARSEITRSYNFITHNAARAEPLRLRHRGWKRRNFIAGR